MLGPSLPAGLRAACRAVQLRVLGKPLCFVPAEQQTNCQLLDWCSLKDGGLIADRSAELDEVRKKGSSFGSWS